MGSLEILFHALKRGSKNSAASGEKGAVELRESCPLDKHYFFLLNMENRMSSDRRHETPRMKHHKDAFLCPLSANCLAPIISPIPASIEVPPVVRRNIRLLFHA